MGKRVWDEGQVITALCLWEAWLELEGASNNDGQATELATTMLDYRGQHGSYVLRSVMLDLIEECDDTWEAADALDHDACISFDFEHCSDFIKGCIKSGRIGTALERQYAPRPGLS